MRPGCRSGRPLHEDASSCRLRRHSRTSRVPRRCCLAPRSRAPVATPSLSCHSAMTGRLKEAYGDSTVVCLSRGFRCSNVSQMRMDKYIARGFTVPRWISRAFEMDMYRTPPVTKRPRDAAVIWTQKTHLNERVSFQLWPEIPGIRCYEYLFHPHPLSLGFQGGTLQYVTYIFRVVLFFWGGNCKLKPVRYQK